MVTEEHVIDERDDAVEQELDVVQERVHGAVAVWTGRVQDESLVQLADLLRVTAQTIEGLTEMLSDDAPDSAEAYRSAYQDRVVEPLRQRLGVDQPCAVLVSAHAELLDALSTVAADIDEIVGRSEPAGLYDAASIDSMVRRFRKAVVRGRRVLRGWIDSAARPFRRGSSGETTQTPQQVPLADLVAFHARVRLPGELQADHEAICRLVAQALQQVSGALTEHTHVVLDGISGDVNVEAVRASAARLQTQFDAAAAKLSTFERLENVEVRVDELNDRLRRDARESGTFMLDLRNRDARRAVPVRRKAEDRDAAWTTWFGCADDRLRLLSILLDVQRQAEALERQFVADVFESVVAPAHNALESVHDRLNTLSEEARKEFADQVTSEDVTRRLEAALDVVERDGLNERIGHTLRVQARAKSDEVVVALSNVIQALPERIEINVLDEEADPEGAPRRVDVREQAARAYDALVIERLRETIDHVTAALEAAEEASESVPGVLRFNLSTAADDLREADGEETQEAARELVVDGLARSAHVLGSGMEDLDEATEPFRKAVLDVFESGFSTLHDRLRVEERVREHVLDLSSEARAGLRKMAARASDHVHRTSVMARRAYGLTRTRVSRWVRLGQAAAGLADATEEERLETVEALADLDRLLHRFPLVYRRLFTFEPVRDPSLLESREGELRFLRKHVERSARGLSNALVITGFHGSGQTSFLNVARKTVFEDATVCVVDLRTRLHGEKELVARLASALDVGDASTLDQLADLLFEREATSPLKVCIVEHLEHLYLRTVGGTELLERFLSFISRTDSRVSWINTVSEYGWQVMRTAEPSASSLVEVQGLAPISRAGLEAIILNRHRRSGLPLRFDVPEADSNPIFSRRLRKARTESERQAILQSEYFDRLHRASGQNIMLALLYWLRSADMVPEEGALRIKAIEPLQFGFLQTFDLEKAFTLKSLLEHASLTIEEHSEVFRVSQARSVDTFEALGNLLLIEPLLDKHVHSRFAFETVEEGVRYRIRPLLIHPIIQFLRSRNILH